MHRGVATTPPLLGHGVWKRRIYSPRNEVGVEAVGTRKEIQKAEDQSRSLEARPFARPKLVGVERECALGEAAVFRHGASLGTGLRPDALDRT